jgi:hypothetical protein
MKKSLQMSFAVLFLFAVLAAAPAQAEIPGATSAVAAPALVPTFLTAVPAEPTWDPALLVTPEFALSLDPLAGAQGTACAPVCALCPYPCLKSNCHREGLCLRCC